MSDEVSEDRGWFAGQQARGRAAYECGLALWLERPRAAIARLVGLGGANLISSVALATLVGAVALRIAGEPVDPGVWWWHLVSLGSSTPFVFGAAGVFATATALAWLLDAVTEGFVWAQMEGELVTEVDAARLFIWEAGSQWVPWVLVWHVLRSLVRAALLVGTTMVYVSLVMATASGDAIIGPALLTGGIYAAGILYILLASVTLEWIPACLVVGSGRPTFGESVLRAAHEAIDQLVSTYRLLVQSLSWVIAPLMLYGVALGLESAALSDPELAPWCAGLRWGAQVFASVAIAGVGLVFRAGTFFLHHTREGTGRDLEEMAAARTRRGRSAKAASGLAHLGRDGGGAEVVVELDDLLPTEAPNRLVASDLVGAAPLQGEAAMEQE